jgi:cytochrome c2
MRTPRLIGLFSLLVVAVAASRAMAVVQFQNAFFKEYVDEHKDKKFAEFVKKEVKCLVCHQGKDRHNHNAYGEHLEELLDRKKDTKDAAKIKAALEKVGKMHSDPKDDKSPTYAELIAQSKLPGGELEELKKEPKKEEKK